MYRTSSRPTQASTSFFVVAGFVLVLAGMFITWGSSPIPSSSNIGNLDEHVIQLPAMVITP